VYLANSDHAIFPALYERIVCGARPDVAIGSDTLVRSSWFLRAMKRAVPDIFVPFVDDGGARHALLERLVSENLRAGRPVDGESPIPVTLAHTIPVARAYAYSLSADPPPGDPARPPPHYEGEMGGRVATFVALERAAFEAQRGDLAAAARAAGVDVDVSTIPAGVVPLWPHLPRHTPVFLSAPWQRDVIVRDLTFLAGHGAGSAPTAATPYELRLLYAWHLYRANDRDGAETILAALGPTAAVETARAFALAPDLAPAAETVLRDQLTRTPEHEDVELALGGLLATHGRAADAEPIFRAAAAHHPKSARALRDLSECLVQLGKTEEAKDTLSRAEALER
jgi:hypothetical protein